MATTPFGSIGSGHAPRAGFTPNERIPSRCAAGVGLPAVFDTMEGTAA
jgi:hypothetical protein